MSEPSEFFKKVIAVIRKIPKGKIATYGQVAALAGKPHAARGVSWILHSSSTRYELPWHRVMNSKGQIAFSKRSSNYDLQKKRLQAEGVSFLKADQVDLASCQWKKRAPAKKPTPRQPKMFS